MLKITSFELLGFLKLDFRDTLLYGMEKCICDGMKAEECAVYSFIKKEEAHKKLMC